MDQLPPRAGITGDASALWARFQAAVATTDAFLTAHPDSADAPSTDPRRIALDRCVEEARAYALAWKQAFLADVAADMPMRSAA